MALFSGDILKDVYDVLKQYINIDNNTTIFRMLCIACYNAKYQVDLVNVECKVLRYEKRLEELKEKYPQYENTYSKDHIEYTLHSTKLLLVYNAVLEKIIKAQDYYFTIFKLHVYYKDLHAIILQILKLMTPNATMKYRIFQINENINIERLCNIFNKLGCECEMENYELKILYKRIIDPDELFSNYIIP